MNDMEQLIPFSECYREVGIKLAYFNNHLLLDESTALSLSAWGADDFAVPDHSVEPAKKMVDADKSEKICSSAINYWQKQLRQLCPQPCFTPDKVRSGSTGSSTGSSAAACRQVITTTEDKQLLRRLRDKCEREKIALYDFMYSAFTVLVSRYSDQTEIVTGAAGIEQRCNDVGAFGNILILRSNLCDNPTFPSLVKRNRNVVKEALRYRCIPIDVIFNQLGFSDFTPGDINPLFQVMFSFARVKTIDAAVTDTAFGPMSGDNGRGHLICDIDLQVVQGEQGLYIRLLYNPCVFEAATVERIAINYRVLLNNILDNFDGPINGFDVVSGSEYRTLIGLSSVQSRARPLVLIKSLEQSAAQYPSKIAIKHRRELISYQSLNQRANRLARHLLKKGVKPGSVVAVIANREASLLVVIISIIKAGAVYLPVDTTIPEQHIRQLLSDADPDIIIAENSLSHLAQITHSGFIDLDDSMLKSTLEAYCSSNPDIDVPECDAACIIHKRGSVKNLVLSHRSINNRLSWIRQQYPLACDDICAVNRSSQWDDYLAQLFYPLSQGCTCVLWSDDDINQADAFIQTLVVERVTWITLCPSYLKVLLRQSNTDLLSRLKLVICSGEYLAAGVAKNLVEKLPWTRLVNIYGATGTGAYATHHELNYHCYRPAPDCFRQSDSVKIHVGKSNGKREDYTFALSSSITSADAPVETLISKFENALLPSVPVSTDEYLNTLKTDVIPYLVNVSAKNYIGHMTSALPDFVPEFSKLIAFFNQNMVKVETSKSLSLIERQVLAMTHRILFELPDQFYDLSIQQPDKVFGVVTSGGSVANLTALACARNRALIGIGFSSGDIVAAGANRLVAESEYSRAVILCSGLAHYSIRKSALVLGIGEENIRLLPQDEQQRVSIHGLQRQIEKCRKKNELIICIIGIAGATETGTVDPLTDMAQIAKRHNIHFHVDAAWGGAFKFSRKYRHKIGGCELADSITLCAHKQLYLPQGISICLFRNTSNEGVIPVNAHYQSHSGSYDLGQYSLEGSRPALSLLLHAAYHLIAGRGYESLIDNSMSKTAYFTHLITLSEEFELLGQPELNIVNYRYIPKAIRNAAADGFGICENRQISEAVDIIQQYQFEKGDSFVSRTRLTHPACPNELVSVFRVVLSNPQLGSDDLHGVLQDQLVIAKKLIEKTRVESGEMQSPAADKTAPPQAAAITSTAEKLSVPIGKPIDNITAYVLDSSAKLAPMGAKGMLYLSGAGSEKDCIRNPFSKKDDVLVKTGDIARWTNEGDLELVAGADSRIVYRGCRIDAAEIEAHLSSFDGVDEAAVIVRDADTARHQIEGGMEACLVLDNSVIAAGDHHFEKEKFFLKLRNRLRKILPPFMLPVRYRLLKDMPRQANGKRDKQALYTVLSGDSPMANDHFRLGNYVAPGNHLEATLCKVWKNDLDVIEVGTKDNYFNIGGDSRKAEITAKNISTVVGLDIAPAMLIRSKTVGGLCREIDIFRGVEYIDKAGS